MSTGVRPAIKRNIFSGIIIAAGFYLVYLAVNINGPRKDNKLPFKVTQGAPLGYYVDGNNYLKKQYLEHVEIDVFSTKALTNDKGLLNIRKALKHEKREYFKFSELVGLGKMDEYIEYDHVHVQNMEPGQVIAIVRDDSGRIVAIAGKWRIGCSESIRDIMETYGNVWKKGDTPLNKTNVEMVSKSEMRGETRIFIVRKKNKAK